MSDSLRCPFCGAIGGRPLSLGHGDDGRAGTGDPAADHYECEVCRQVWDDRTAPKADAVRT